MINSVDIYGFMYKENLETVQEGLFRQSNVQVMLSYFTQYY